VEESRDRIFVEWYDVDRPGWGGFVNTLDSDFLAVFREMVAEYGAPTKVEYRADTEGWVKGGDHAV
jgi:hypothetical protein